jgi:hypothetical protein
MESSYIGINIPNIISVGIIAAILWAVMAGVKMAVKKHSPQSA